MRWLLVSDILVAFVNASFRLGCDLRHGLRRGQWATSRPSHYDRSTGRNLCIIPSSHFADNNSANLCCHHLRHVYAFSRLYIAFLTELSRVNDRLLYSRAEEFGDTSRKALIVSYREPERRGQMIGAYYLIRDSIVSVGAILGAYLWSRSPAANFLPARPHLALPEQSFT